MPTNEELIRMHLETFLSDNAQSDCPLLENWSSLLSYALGYYGEITVEIINVVRDLQREGKIE